MSTSREPSRQRRTPVRSALPWIVLLPLAQAGLGFLSERSSSPWLWLIGTPLCYLLIGVLHTEEVHPPSASRLPGPGLALFALFFWFVPFFVLLNLLGIALAPLGGMLGGALRSHAASRPLGQPPSV